MPFEENMNILRDNPGIEIKVDPISGDLNIISKLDDEPNDVGGMSPEELKHEFDKAGLTIQQYINETLIPQVVGQGNVEAQRVKAEADRVLAEKGRVSAESERVAAEQQRVEAEQQRVEAEQARADRDTGIVAQATKQAEAAAQSAQDAAASQQAAGQSEANAAASAGDAADQVDLARIEVRNAAAQVDLAKAEVVKAQTEVGNAAAQVVLAKAEVSKATTQAEAAADSAQSAATQADRAETEAVTARSWSSGGTGTRPGEDTDNSRHWYQRAKDIADTLAGVFKNRGTVQSVSDLPPDSNAVGDAFYVLDAKTFYTWQPVGGVNQWVPLGDPIDISSLLKKSELADTTGTGTETAMTQQATTQALLKKLDKPSGGTTGDLLVRQADGSGAWQTLVNRAEVGA